MKTKKGPAKKKNYCSFCQKTIIGSSYKFNAHLYLHNAVKARFKCNVCSQEFFRSDVYNRHMNKHREGNDIPRNFFICDHCDRAFVVKRNLQFHLKIHDDIQEHKYQCEACGVAYCEERLLKYHIRKNHYNLHEPTVPHIGKELNETWVERVKESDVCVQMTKINDNVISIQKFGTIKMEIEKKPEVTDEKVKFKEYISSVFAQNDKSQYSKAICDYCHKEMLKKSLLSHIRERHQNMRRFKCEECNSTFKRHYQLVDHECGKKRRGLKKERLKKSKNVLI